MNHRFIAVGIKFQKDPTGFARFGWIPCVQLVIIGLLVGRYQPKKLFGAEDQSG